MAAWEDTRDNSFSQLTGLSVEHHCPAPMGELAERAARGMYSPSGRLIAGVVGGQASEGCASSERLVARSGHIVNGGIYEAATHG